jgi:hypothetical protein
VASILVASPALAQQHTGALSGLVKDSAGTAIANVEVTALSLGKVVRTDTAGKFFLPAVPSGSTKVSFRRLAYEPAILSIKVEEDDTTEVEVKLGVVAQRLTAMIVEAPSDRSRFLEAFERRRAQGIGHFITRADIEKRNPLRLSDMMRTIPGAELWPSQNGQVALRFARNGPRNCPPQFFIDGIQANGFNVDDMPPGDVEGVEIYFGASGLPPEFNRMRSTAICGVVAIWTRIPGT